MARIYVASSWRNPYQPAVVADLRSAGHVVYDFRHPDPANSDDHGFHWNEIDPAWETWMPEDFIGALHHPVAKQAYSQDMSAMCQAHCCVLVLPCGKSAHLEAGWFCGRGRPCYIYMAEPDGSELMYNMAAGLFTSLADLLVEIATWDGEATGLRRDPWRPGC